MPSYTTRKAHALAAELEARLVADPELTADEERGDLVIDGRQIIRVGSIIRIATFEGHGAIDHGDAETAKAAFEMLP